MKFPRATSQPLGTEDWIIDVPFLKHVKYALQKRFGQGAYESIDLEQIEQVLLAVEDETEGHSQGGVEHVCGLEGYNGMIDPPCPACQPRHLQGGGQ